MLTNKLKTLTLIRDYKPEATIGRLIFDGLEIAKSLELPNLGNKSNVSCIPEGVYEVVVDNHGKHRYFKILGVVGREDIEIHIANTIKQLRGCLSFGEKLLRNVEYKKEIHPYFLSNSRKKMDNLKKSLPARFLLNITSKDTLCKKAT